MKRMVPLESVVVVRDGKRVTPPIGKGFNFTDAEVQQLRESRPEAIREPINEGEQDSQSNVRTAAGRVAEGGVDTRDELLDGADEGGGSDDGGEKGSGGQTDADIEEANEQAADEKAKDKIEKAVSKVAGRAATKRARGPAPKLDDDL